MDDKTENGIAGNTGETMTDVMPVTPERAADGRQETPDERHLWLIDLAGMVRFFSRLPLPSLCAGDVPSAMPDYHRAARVMPFAGVIIALPAALALLLLAQTALPALLIALLALVVLVLSTGAFHEDGLADVADGVGGGWKVADKLRIMRDSRIGTYGGSALILSLAIRAVATAAILEREGAIGAAFALLLVAGASRTLSSWVAHFVVNVREDGASSAYGRPSREAMLTASVFCLVLILPAMVFLGVAPVAIATVLAAMAVALFARYIRGVLGGQTGDVLGAAEQIAEIAMLCGLLCVMPAA